MTRNEIITELKSHYIPNRLQDIDTDYLEFEEQLSKQEDLELILKAISNKTKLPNPHNSCLLYLVGITNEFDFIKGRSDMTGGAAPDIDVDLSAEDRDKVVEMIVKEWGRDHVANIITHGTLKPKSLTRRFFKTTMPLDLTEADAHSLLMKDILSKIPEPLFGKEATLKEVIEGNIEKGYSPHPELLTTRYAAWYKFASKLEDMISNFGIHAAGVVISDNPIYEQIPTWSNGKSERITQFDMHETEALGGLKVDFLVINNLDILKECVRLIHLRTNKKYDIYDIPDCNTKAYKLLHDGLVQGIFQMETSKITKELLTSIKPNNISELSDVTSLARPGPLEFAPLYLENKLKGYPPKDLHPLIAELTKETHYVLVYQETVMKICQEVAGYSLRESDDIRRAMGKKDEKKLKPYKESFIKGCISKGMTENYATDYWDKTLMPFASYAFNKSHAVSYSYITYLCAYFKANYPAEFFCALMSTRATTMSPAEWAEKAPEYILEARELGIKIHSPSIQTSEAGFTINGSDIYFGLNAIRSCGLTATKAIIKARGHTRFKDIWDFLSRIDQRVINTKILEALTVAGAFDIMGYKRAELLEKIPDLATYLPSIQEWMLHESTRTERELESERVLALRLELDNKVREAKAKAKELKKQKLSIPEDILPYLDIKETFRLIAEYGSASQELTDLYEKYGKLTKPHVLKAQEKPIEPVLTRHKQLTISVEELMNQALYIGCYLGVHPARVLYPQSKSLISLEEDDYQATAGQITNARVFKTKKGDTMAFLVLNDGTASAELVVFSKTYSKLLNRQSFPTIGDIVMVSGKVEATNPVIKLRVDNLILHKRQDDNIKMV